MILSVYSIPSNIILILISIIGLYLFGELLFIMLFGKQNLFFGKDLRTAFYILLALVLFFRFDPTYLIYFYSIIALIHATGFFLPKYRN